MFRLIEEYINRSKKERQIHLRLKQECIEIGTNSIQCRALLAHHLKTTVPKGMKILCCHACNNAGCSNPNHLYWGTASENIYDAIESGARVPTRHSRVTRKLIGKKMSFINTGRKFTKEHRRNLSIAISKHKSGH